MNRRDWLAFAGVILALIAVYVFAYVSTRPAASPVVLTDMRNGCRYNVFGARILPEDGNRWECPKYPR